MTTSKEIVYALIPNSADPELRILNKNGDFPSQERRAGETYEKTLHSIGGFALESSYLSVNRRRTDVEGPLRASSGADTVVAYETQPLPSDAALNEGYEWGYLEDPTK